MKNKYSKEIREFLLLMLIKYSESQKSIEDAMEDIELEEGNGKTKVYYPKLKPDSPTFIENPRNIKNVRLKINNDLKNDNDIFFVDLIALIETNSLSQFGLPKITMNDLNNNNIQTAILVLNKNGKILNIVSNKGANQNFLNLLINNKLENKIENSYENKKTLIKRPKPPTPFD